MTTTTTSFDDLAKLGSVAEPIAAPPAPPVVEPPAPEVVARARELADQGIGDSTYEVREGSKVVIKSEDRKNAESVVEAADRQAFLAHLLGAPYFAKEYELFGGAVVLTFHSITCADDDLALTQAAHDEAIDTSIAGSNGAMARMARFSQYKMLLGLQSIRFADARPTIKLDPLEKTAGSYEGASPSPGHTRLRRALRLLKQQLPGPLFFQALEHSVKFFALVNTLTEKAEEPGFWTASTGP